MITGAVLIEVLDRITANNGAVIFISNNELHEWPADAVTAMQAHQLIVKSRPAKNVVCPGCEQSCFMPVQIPPAQNGTQTSFVVCDKRDDINRVRIPLEHLEQWQSSGHSVATMVSKLLDLHSPTSTSSNRWELGVFRGSKHSSHIILTIDNIFFLSIAGHELALNELLSIVDKLIRIDRRKITHAVDHPAAGAGDNASVEERRNRLQKRVNELKAKNIKGFLKKVAEEEGISVSRLKQILAGNSTKPKEKSIW
jgi:hypothetical protein